MWERLISVSKRLDLFGRGSDSQLWDWLTIRPIGWKREGYEQSFWLCPQVECWLVIGSQDSDACIIGGFICFVYYQWYSYGRSESAEPKSESPHDMWSWYWLLRTELVRPSGTSLCFFRSPTPPQTELLHNKSLSHTFNLRILKNSAILFQQLYK